MGGNYSPRLYNYDGSRNVYCRQCWRPIAALSSGQANFGSAICAICHAANTGEDLSPEIQDQLTNNMRMSSGFMVPRSTILPEVKDVPDDPILGKDKKEGLISYWGRVLKAAVFAAVDVIKEGEEPLSKKIARQRKRSRVFAIEDMDNKVITAEDRIDAKVVK